MSSPLNDSGNRSSAGGGVRDRSAENGRYDLISPVVMHKLARHLAAGAEKYEPRNWEKGMPLSWCLDSAERHLNKLKCGMKDEDHAIAALCNMMFFIHLNEAISQGILDESFDDLPKDIPTIESIDSQ